MGARKNRILTLPWVLALGAVVFLCPLALGGDDPADAPSRPASTKPVKLRLATGSVGGTFLPVGRDLALWWAKTLPDVSIEVLTTAGSIENLDLLVSGEAEIAIVGSSPFREVLDGWGTNSDEAKKICLVGTLYMDAEQFVVRDSLVRTGNLLDLTGLLMYPGPHGSGGEIDTRLIMNVLGIEPRFVYADERTKGYAAAAAALARGDFDAATFSGGVPIQAVTQLFRDHPGEYRILPFTRHMLRRLQHYESDFEGVVIRKGSYPGMTEDIQAVGGPNVLVAAPSVPDSVVRVLARAIREGIETPGEGLRAESVHPVLQVMDPELWNLDPVSSRCIQAMADLNESAGAPTPR